MCPHVEDQDHQRQRHGDLEPPGEIDQLFVWRILRHHPHGLQRHAANRARAWAFLDDLGMHGAGEQRAGWCRFGFILFVQIALGVRGKFCLTAGGAEMIDVPLVVVTGFAGMRINRHSADGINDGVCVGGCGFCHAFKTMWAHSSYRDSNLRGTDAPSIV